MDLLSPSPTTNSPLTPVFGDNVQNLLGTGALQVNPSAIITVNSIADSVDDSNSGVTTLRDAINQANASNRDSIIVFARSLFSTAQTISLSLGELDITHNLDIIAPRDSLTGGNLVTVSGNNTSRVFEIESGATVALSGLIVADGLVTGDNGGGILNSGTLTIDSSIVRGNFATISRDSNNFGKGGDGGAIYNTGIVNISNSTLSDNSTYTVLTTTQVNKIGTPFTSVVKLGNGGGIYNNGTLSVFNSTISGNATSQLGGGIYSNNSGTLTINNSTISGNSTSGNGGGIFITTNSIVTVMINNSTISGNSTRSDGSGYGVGGGIYSIGKVTLTVSDSTISDNSAWSGGGILNSATNSTLTVNNSTISGNSASFSGGGISEGGKLTVNNSTISGNSASQLGGGIFSTDYGGISTVNNSTISGNSGKSGGGICNFSYFDSTLTVNNSTISGNSAVSDGGGIYTSGTSTVLGSTISGNSASSNGGGIYSYNGISTVRDSTISGNSASGNGGGIYNSSNSTVLGSTISENSATQKGGGIYNDYTGTITLLFSTVTQNQAANGGGVYQNDVPPPFLLPRGSNNVRNTIIAANLNSDGSVNPDVSGTFSSNGYNLIGDSTGSTRFVATGDIVGTSDNPIDPRLAPLDFNSGATQTLALLPDSPAIGAGDPTVLDTDPTTDQRGLPRRALDGSTDIGAFEFSV